MRMLIKQRLFSWFDSYDIYNELNQPIFTVKGQPAWGHCFKIFDMQGNELAAVKEKVLSFMPKFELYMNGNRIGCISKQFVLFKHRFNIDFNGWRVEGNMLGWDYTIFDSVGIPVAIVSKELAFTDTYVINVPQESDALYALMAVLAIDADKCNNNNDA